MAWGDRNENELRGRLKFNPTSKHLKGVKYCGLPDLPKSDTRRDSCKPRWVGRSLFAPGRSGPPTSKSLRSLGMSKPCQDRSYLCRLQNLR